MGVWRVPPQICTLPRVRIRNTNFGEAKQTMKGRSQGKVWEREMFPGVLLIRGIGICTEFRRHTHRSILVGVVRKGRRRIAGEREELDVRPGEGFILPAMFLHRCFSQGLHNYRIAGIHADFWATAVGRIPSRARRLEPGSAPLLAARQLIACLRGAPDAASFGEKLSRLAESLDEPAATATAAMPMPENVRAVRAYLDEHFTRLVRLSELASLAACTPATINRLFRQSIGLPPYEYLMQNRLRAAARHLRDGAYSLADIAAETGFADQSHLQRMFKRAFGTTPKVYRNRG